MDVEKQPRDSIRQTAPHHQKGVSSKELTKRRRRRDARLTPEDETKLEEQRKDQKDERYTAAAQAEVSYRVLRNYLNKRHQQHRP